jgi:hypothetical membrane protein
MKPATIRFLALGGIAGPILYAVTSLIASAMRTDYNHISQMLSELAATGTPNALLMNVLGFNFSGLMITAFGIALFTSLPPRVLPRVGAILITTFGALMFILGFIACDAGCPEVGSAENALHDQLSGPAFLSAILATLLLGFAFRRIPAWQKLSLYSFITGLVSIGFLAGLITSFDDREYIGLWQRLLLLTLFLWIIQVALHIRWLHRVDSVNTD